MRQPFHRRVLGLRYAANRADVASNTCVTPITRLPMWTLRSTHTWAPSDRLRAPLAASWRGARGCKPWMISRLTSLLETDRVKLETRPCGRRWSRSCRRSSIRSRPSGNYTGNAASGSHDDLITCLGLATMLEGSVTPRCKREMYARPDPTWTTESISTVSTFEAMARARDPLRAMFGSHERASRD
jgi:hypothetical protein